MDMGGTETNFASWKLAELCSYLVAAVGAVVMSATVGNLPHHFDNKCPLHTRLQYEVRNTSQREIRVVDDALRLWEPLTSCELSTFLPVGCAACALVMAYFILMCDRVEKLPASSPSRNRMLGLFFPLLFGSLVLSILMLIASTQTSVGVGEFCDALTQSLNLSCADAETYEWPDYPNAGHFYQTMLAAQISGWLSTVGCISSMVVLVLRCLTGVDWPDPSAHKLLPNRGTSPITAIVSLQSSFRDETGDQAGAGPSGVSKKQNEEVDDVKA